MPRYRNFADGETLSIDDLRAMEADRESMSGWNLLVRRGAYIRSQSGDEITDNATPMLMTGRPNAPPAKPISGRLYPSTGNVFTINSDLLPSNRRAVCTIRTSYLHNGMLAPNKGVESLFRTGGYGSSKNAAGVVVPTFTLGASLATPKMSVFQMPASGLYALGYTAKPFASPLPYRPGSGFVSYDYEVRFQFMELWMKVI